MPAPGKRFEISVDTTALNGLDDKLKVLDNTALRELRATTVELVALRARTKAVDETFSQLNLTRDYIESAIDRAEMASKGNTDRALVRSKVRGTTLQRFGIGLTQGEVSVNWRPYQFKGPEGKFRPGPGGANPNKRTGWWGNTWTPRTGDDSNGRNIRPNFKADGVLVQVMRGRSSNIERGVIMPLNRGTEAGGNGFGVFTRIKGRTRKDKKQFKHRYGPSVYQTFRRFITERQGPLQDDLADTFILGLDKKLAQL